MFADPVFLLLTAYSLLLLAGGVVLSVDWNKVKYR